jgi:histidinol-phosphate/aromatic aminotransferase/cobyric acid decarboxylase-like protein
MGSGHVRVSIGTQKEMERLLKLIQRFTRGRQK